jgi:ATP/maltotriose-dependent transcriptional regulator MalT/DNA-binding SARP family transcriptional activator
MGKTAPPEKTFPTRSKKNIHSRSHTLRSPENKIIPRLRLFNLLASNRDKKMILILGQAAQGKTTLASSFLAHEPQAHVWINLTAEDFAPVNLFFKWVQALQSTFTEKDLSPLLHLPSQTISPRPEDLLYRDWVRAAVQSIPNPLLIVLDGLDRLGDQAPSWKLLQILLEETPPEIRLFFLSRERPRLNLEKRMMSQEAFILTNDDLAFTLDEVMTFFKRNRPNLFTSEQLRTIHQTTQGWAGGLRILLELVGTQRGVQPDPERLDRILESLTHRAFEYFNEELFSTFSEARQEVLIRSSIFEDIELQTVKELFPDRNAEEFLENLVQRNLFVSISFDRTNGRHYRFHQLFRDFLQEKFNSRYTKADQRHFLNQTADILEKTGDLEKALSLFLKAENFQQARALVKRIGLDLFKQGKTEVLARYLEIFPQDFFQNDPWLLFFLSLTRRWLEIEGNIERLKKALHLFERQKDEGGILLTLAYLIEALMLKGGSWKEILSFIQRGETDPAYEHHEGLTYERTTLSYQIGMTHTIRGNLLQGYRASQKAYLLAQKIGNDMIQGRSLFDIIIAKTFLGDYEQAEVLIKKMHTFSERIQAPDFRFYYYLSKTVLETFHGEEESSFSAIEKALMEVDSKGLHYWQPVAVMNQLFQAVYFDQFEKSQRLGTFLLKAAERMGLPFIKAVATLFLGVNFFRKDFLAEAIEWLSRAVRLLSADESRTEYHLHYALALRTLVLIHGSKTPPPDKELAQAINYFEAVQAPLFLAESYLIAALLASTQNRRDQVLEYLTAGTRLLLEKNYDHFMLIRGQEVALVSTLLLEYEVPKAQECITGLLAKRYGPLIKGEMKKLFNHPRSVVRERAREIYKAVHRTKVPLLHLKTLGPFQVLRAGTPLKDEEWEGKVAKKMLKAVLSYGSPRVPKDWLLETLWPEASPTSAERNFKTTLHRLRISLEPEMDEAAGSSYVHQKNNLVFLDEQLCRRDTDHFLSLVQQGRDEEKNGRFQEALSFFQEAERLYQGDFLTEDLYEIWILPRQEEMKRCFVEILFKLARLYQTRGSFRPAETCLRKIILNDPLNEEAYRKLMLHYSDHGHRNEALKVYEQCRQVLKSALDVSPDKSTTAIYKKLTAPL